MFTIMEKEVLALIWALQNFEVHVRSGCNPAMVYTDNDPFTFLCSIQNPNQHLMRWCLFLKLYNIDILYIKSVENVLAAAVCRAVP